MRSFPNFHGLLFSSAIMGLVSFGRLIKSFILENISSCLYPAMDSKDTIILLGVQSFDYCELEDATNNFDPSRKLGTGGYSTVYHGILKDGRVVAIKMFEKRFTSMGDEMDRCTIKMLRVFKNEVAILSRLNHENLIRLHGCSTLENLSRLLIVQEYVSNGSLADHLHGARKKAGALPWATRLNIAIQTATALAYLHGCRIVHRDVKTSNILVDYRFNAKVTDFGLSRLFPEDVSYVSTKLAGSCGYIDPQYSQSFQLTPKSDVYSFGVVMIELISSKPAACEDGFLSTFAVNKIMNKEIHKLVDPSLGFEQTWTNTTILAVAELAFSCLQHERHMRPSMDEVLDTLKSIGYGTAMIPLAWNQSSGHKVTDRNIHIVSRLPDTFFDK